MTSIPIFKSRSLCKQTIKIYLAPRRVSESEQASKLSGGYSFVVCSAAGRRINGRVTTY